jgi:tRNA-specific 2-thiouridylase
MSVLHSTEKIRRRVARVRKTVFVGLSGGVDSSVTALLLKQQGFFVVGVHLRCWNEGGCDVREAEDARRIAEQLDIPFYVFDMQDAYRKRVVDYMIREYREGRTPNPDIMCNKEVKFGLFLEKALSLGADHIATGHYVRLRTTERNGKVIYRLYRGKDKKKDQTYFLWTLGQAQLQYCLFPVGEYEKKDIRAFAKDAGLITHDKKDSQGICFVGNIPLRDFLDTYIPKKPGDVLDESGSVIGSHDGVQFYTIGQRHGFTLFKHSPNARPHYIVRKDAAANTLVVAEGAESEALYEERVLLREVHFIDEVFGRSLQGRRTVRVYARVRYGQPLFKARAYNAEDGVMLEFDTPQQFVASGQSAVLYKGTGEMIGGGIIV